MTTTFAIPRLDRGIFFRSEMDPPVKPGDDFHIKIFTTNRTHSPRNFLLEIKILFYEQPDVDPHELHFKHAPFLTIVNCPHS